MTDDHLREQKVSRPKNIRNCKTQTISGHLFPDSTIWFWRCVRD